VSNSAIPTITHDDKFASPQTLRGGQKFIIDAKVTGIPAPTTSWSFNGQALTASPSLTVEATASTGKLTFVDSKAEQSGVYVLKAENSVGSAEAEFTITVKGAFTPELKLQFQLFGYSPFNTSLGRHIVSSKLPIY